MLSRFATLHVPRAVILAGAVICGLWLLALLAISDFDYVPFRAVRVVGTNGQAIVETRFNPLAIFGLSASATMILWGAALYLARPLEAIARRLRTGSAGRIASASETLERELGNVLAVLRTSLLSSQTHARTLTVAQQRLAGLSGGEQVRVVVSLLVAENERMRRDCADLEHKIATSAREIETLRLNLGEAEQAALTDPLTNVGNRRQFDAVMRKAVDDSNALQTPLSLIMGDIDHFKRVNDSFGHQVGDDIIKLFVGVIAKSVRETDTVARYGGEEFAIILPKADEETAISIAERIRTRFAGKNISLRGSNRPVGRLSASFGVAQLRPGEEAEHLLERADRKLYEAKASGRNRVAASARRGQE
jgi:diguanylate cyclase